jgi:hypothetical protein
MRFAQSEKVDQPVAGRHLGGEEIGRDQGFPMGL